MIKRKHHELHVWQEAISLVKEIYKVSKKFSQDELYVLTAHMRKAAISSPSNIAEGAARNSTKEFLHFLGIARGSLSELETQTIIAREIGYLSDSTVLEQKIDDVFGLLGGLINSLKNS